MGTFTIYHLEGDIVGSKDKGKLNKELHWSKVSMREKRTKEILQIGISTGGKFANMS